MPTTVMELLETLEAEQRSQVLAQVRRGKFTAQTVLIEEGEEDDTLMIVEKGELRIIRSGVPVDTSGPGEMIGEMSLFGDGRRSASVHVMRDCSLLMVDKPAYEVLRALGNPFAFWVERQALRFLANRLRRINAQVGELAQGDVSPWVKPPASVFERIRGLFKNAPKELFPLESWDVGRTLGRSPLFAETPRRLLPEIAKAFEVRTVDAGTFLCEQGQPGDALFMIASGAVDVLITTGRRGRTLRVHRLAQVGEGDAVGLSALADGAPRSASCVAVEATTVFSLSRDQWEALRARDDEIGSEVRRVVIRGFSGALSESAEHLVREQRRRAGRPVVPTLGPPSAVPAPSREVSTSTDPEGHGPAQIFLDPRIGIRPSNTGTHDLGALRAAAAAEISRDP